MSTAMPAATPADADAPLRLTEPQSTPPATGPGLHWPLSRAQAFFVHLALSVLVFATLVMVMVTLWFPGELFVIDGGWEGLKLVAMVDLVLGPALTLLLYRPHKPGVRVDMAIIAAIQIAALGYGFVTTWQQRTVAVVYADGLFNTLSASAHANANADLAELEAVPRRVSELAEERVPVLVNPPPTSGEFGSYLTELFNGWPEPHERSDRFVPARDARDALAEGALPLDGFDASTREAVERALDEQRLSADAVQLYRFRTRYARGVTIFDPDSARVLDWVESEPASLAAALPEESEAKTEAESKTGTETVPDTDADTGSP